MVLQTIIACGTFNGDLLLWDTAAQEDYELGKSCISDASHQDSIVQASAMSTRFEHYQKVETSS